MEFAEQQLDAIRRCEMWLEAHRIAQASQTRAPVPQTFRLFGEAGTGKTTLLKKLLESVTWGRTLAGSFTGKAASVMTRKGVPADTIHSTIYKPAGEAGAGMLKQLAAEERKLLQAIEAASGPDEVIRAELRNVRDKIRMEKENEGRPFFALQSDSPLRGAALMAIDEVSMVDRVMGEDLLSFGTPLLVLGDPFQLPPVKGTGYFMEGQPDVLLTEVHRHAGPILQMARLARLGRQIALGENVGDDSRTEVIRGRPAPDRVMAADQILCGRNATRFNLNRRVRSLKGFDPSGPVRGDKLVCTKNNRELGLLNGTLWTIADVRPANERGKLLMRLIDEMGNENPYPILAHEAPFIGRDVPKYEFRDAEMFDYGYALTVHKSQGSQWEDVVMFDDWTGSERREWLYTGITRAASSLLLVQ